MTCSNSARNAETQHLMHKVWRVIVAVVQVGAVKIYVAAVEALRKKGKRKDRMKLSLPKLMVF